MHGIAWYCMVLHNIAWYCMVLYGIALSCTILHHLAPFYTILHHLAPFCTILHRVAQCCTMFAPCCTMLHQYRSSIEDRCVSEKVGWCWVTSRSGWLLELLTELTNHFINPDINGSQNTLNYCFPEKVNG